MNRETIIPTDEKHWHTLRSKVITSTEIAALFGISPWLTSFELWHRKKDSTIVELEPNERMKWGNRLQDAIANGYAEDFQLDIRLMKEFIQIPEWRMGSSFDYAVGDLGGMEVKNVDSLAYKDGWLVNGDSIEAPPHIEIQVQYQLLVSGRQFWYIAPLIGGNRTQLLKRVPDLAVHEAIKSKVAAFWQSIDAGIEPQPDFKADADFIAKLESYAEPGKVMNATTDEKLADLVRDYKEWGEKESSAKAEKDGIKAQILTLIEDAEKVQGNGWTISASMKPPTLIEAYTRKAYRDFRVYMKKEKN